MLPLSRKGVTSILNFNITELVVNLGLAQPAYKVSLRAAWMFWEFLMR